MTVDKKISRLALAASMALAPPAACAEHIHAYFGPPEDGGASTNLTYSPCTGEEVSECRARPARPPDRVAGRGLRTS